MGMTEQGRGESCSIPSGPLHIFLISDKKGSWEARRESPLSTTMGTTVIHYDARYD